MTDRDALHALVDALPEEDLPRAAEALRGVVGDGDVFELTPEQEEGVRAAMRQLDAGEGVPWETVHAELTARLDARAR